MDLTFNKEGKNFVAEFEATADFNLHIERNKGGYILLYVRTQGGGYDIVDDFGVQKHQGVIDYDCTAFVYPKFIKIVSEVEPTYAAVVSDGEVTEIKAQSKEVEVTSNGTTVVEPDAGFAYLNKVSVKTNVPQEGGGGGTGGDKWIYVDESKLGAASLGIRSFAYLVRGMVEMAGGRMVLPIDNAKNMSMAVEAASICLSAKLAVNREGVVTITTIEDTLRAQELLNLVLAAEITEEEFYNLNA